MQKIKPKAIDYWFNKSVYSAKFKEALKIKECTQNSDKDMTNGVNYRQT